MVGINKRDVEVLSRLDYNLVMEEMIKAETRLSEAILEFESKTGLYIGNISINRSRTYASDFKAISVSIEANTEI